MNKDESEKFEAIFTKNHRSLCGLAYNLIGDLDAAKDIVQDTFLKLWNRRQGVTMESSIANYLKQATIHASYNYINQKKTRMRILSEIEWSTTSEAIEGSENIAYREMEKRAQKAIGNLPPKCRAIFLLSRHEGLKYREIAEQLNISVKTVENQMGIALEKLRDELKPYLTKEFILPLIAVLLAYLLTKILL